VEAQQPAASVQAAFQSARLNPFRDEVFELILEIAAAGIDIGQDIGVRGLPPPDRLVFSQFEELPTQREMRDNVLVSKRRFRSTARATTSGSITLSPVLELKFVSRRRTFFGNMMEERAGDVPVTPLSFNVRELPDGDRPPDFSGTVGNFRYSAVLSPSSVATGELVTLRHTVQGTGYLARAAAPTLPPSPLFRMYTPKMVKDEAGVRSFEQILIPLSTNASALPATGFTFFDPVAERYVTALQGPYRLQFHKASAARFEAYKPDTSVVSVVVQQTMAKGTVFQLRIILATVAVLLFLAGMATFILRRGPAQATMLVAAALLIAGASWLAGSRTSPPFTMASDAPARLCPAETAEQTCPLKAAERVWIREEHAGWVYASTGSRGGWVRETAVRRQAE